MWSYERRKKKEEESRNQNSPNSFGELKNVPEIVRKQFPIIERTGNGNGQYELFFY